MNFPIVLMCAVTIVGMLCAVGIGTIAARLGFPIPDEKRRAGTIDGLRGYLALAVMAQHFTIWSVMTRGGNWQEAPGIILGNFGVLSVTLFFMITGFLFFPKVARGLRETDWRGLYLSRAFRILPLQAVVVVIVSIVALFHVHFRIGDSWLTYPLRVGLWMTSFGQPMLFGYKESSIVNASVLWSLRYEWTFYLVVLPVIALMMSRKAIRSRPFIIPAGMIAIGYFAHLLHPKPLFLDGLGAFGFGMLVRLILDRREYAWAKSPWAAIPVALLAGIVLATIHNPLALYVLAPFALFFFLVAAGNRFGGVVANRGALVLGECSFGIYMLHGIVLHIGFHALWPMLVNWPFERIVLLYPVGAVLAALISMTAFLFIEAPAITLGRRIASGRKARPIEMEPASVTVAP